MKDYQQQQLNRLQAWRSDLNDLIGNLPRLFIEADGTGDYSAVKSILQKKSWERYENYKQFNGHRVRQLHNQSWENDLLWGQVGELLDFFMTKVQTGNVMEWKKVGPKGIDFFTECGYEDTKWSLNKWKDFPIELKSKGNQSHHWNYVDEGKPVYLRFINPEGCWRIKLFPEMKLKHSRSFNNGATELYDCPKEKFEKVWNW